MNIQPLVAVGDTIIITGSVVGDVVRVEGSILTINRHDGRGWLASAEALKRFNLTKGSFWNIGMTQVIGKVVPVSEIVQAPELSASMQLRVKTAPKTPKEPTAPMARAVLGMLRRKGDVTAIEAIGVLRCRSLSKRISELKQLGHKIKRDLFEDHTGQRYARYSLAA